ncbi:N-acetyllactosaminide beta-1,6-N-acetylglucosaminyl-transferase-like [Haliotis rubra]|uniref:N-acetyllactosaminide beta-1,6-N-acetylglucosaminyl-transferase-like n=1 Tax=Haliotis rubra TaxID=36100 RepID=UPI001EE4F1ED|nr:N-acetyllactosaminide beta-1,6-N-acetylglucosaminyl-transferase-like [Haliotis rubra]
MPRFRGKRALLFLMGFFSSVYLMSNLSLFTQVSFQSRMRREILAKTKHHIDKLVTLTPLQCYAAHVQYHSTEFKCDKLFKQDVRETTRSREYLERNNFKFPAFPESVFIKVTKDCGAFKKVLGYKRQYSNIEIEFPLAFSILTHDGIEALERLLRVIYAPQNFYCIHVDRKASPLFFDAVQTLTDCFPNVFIASRLEDLIYAHFSRLRADLNCMEELLIKDRKWKYLLNFASTEIPLKTNLEIVNFLKKCNGSNDIREVYRRRRLERFVFRYSVSEGTLVKTDQHLPPPPHNLTITKGLAYGAFSRHFLEFALTNQIARDFLLWTMDTHSPDEHYWATLNNLYHNPFLHSPGGFTEHPDKKRFISRFVIWNGKEQRYTCHGRYRHNICVFGLGDLPSLKVARKLVANKFDLQYDPVTYACVEEIVRNRTVSGLVLLNHIHYICYIISSNCSL